ncbi:hypothetical protein NDU88_000575 [Pleurodeles waltl]|uniref:Uncharacterized protein n=1 Tax=Pleurodeles waltl TaxID=8319 RepID=A0AAV7P1P8_PLEWA|nr:hypothetical protein NDU88_000575 [Pleurodeles waltl]
MTKRTPRRPRRQNATRAATLQEERGSLRCVQGAGKRGTRGSGSSGGEGNYTQRYQVTGTNEEGSCGATKKA